MPAPLHTPHSCPDAPGDGPIVSGASFGEMALPTLESERLVLRPFKGADFGPLCAFYADEASARFVGGVAEPDQVWRRLASYIGHWHLRGYGFFALEEKSTGAFVGYAGPWYPHGWPEPEIGWGLLPAFRGRGLAREAALRARNFAYGTLGWRTAISFVDRHNVASARLAEALGATPEREAELFGGLATVYRHPPAE